MHITICTVEIKLNYLCRHKITYKNEKKNRLCESESLVKGKTQVSNNLLQSVK